MTSANVVDYTIFHKGKEVGQHSQHCLCLLRDAELLKYEPLHEHTIQPHGLDEEEGYWEEEPLNLRQFLLERHAIERLPTDPPEFHLIFNAMDGKGQHWVKHCCEGKVKAVMTMIVEVGETAVGKPEWSERHYVCRGCGRELAWSDHPGNPNYEKVYEDEQTDNQPNQA